MVDVGWIGAVVGCMNVNLGIAVELGLYYDNLNALIVGHGMNGGVSGYNVWVLCWSVRSSYH